VPTGTCTADKTICVVDTTTESHAGIMDELDMVKTSGVLSMFRNNGANVTADARRFVSVVVTNTSSELAAAGGSRHQISK
jgi:hypothetical protein